MLTTQNDEIRNSEEEFELGYLKCSVEPSAFPHELGVFIKGAEQNYESLIDANLIRLVDANEGRTDSGRVEVTIVQRDDELEAVLVELPRQVVMGGRRIWVPSSEVEPFNPDGHSFPKSD